MPGTWKVLLTAISLTIALGFGGSASRPLDAAPVSPPDVPPDEAPRGSWHVSLDGPTVLELYSELAGPDALDRDARAVRRAAQFHGDALRAMDRVIREGQAPVVRRAEELGARVVGRYTTSANGLLVHGTAAQVTALMDDDGVSRIEPAPIVRPNLNHSVDLIGGRELEATLGYDGTGSIAAVIDTGVDYTHAHLGGPGTRAAFDAANAGRETITDTFDGVALFPTAKVIGGYDFVGRNYDPPHLCTASDEAAGECSSVPQPDDDPLDGGSHGTHVSGIVAGQAVEDLDDGVAPGARLVGLKLYGLGGGDEAADLLVDAIEWCARVNLGLEDRGVVPPRIDAVNISLGEGQAIASSLFDEAVEGAVTAGVVLAASAGNAGNRPFVLGSPSASPKMLSVASSIPPESALEIVTLWNEGGAEQSEVHFALESSIAPPLANFGVIESELAWHGRACDGDEVFQDTDERVALVARGACTFHEKLINAQAAGAIAVLMFTDGRAKNTMGGSSEGIQIPAVMIDNAPGVTLSERLLDGMSVTVLIDPDRTGIDDSRADEISGFSSRGPSRNGALKPDITGPGSSILSASRGSGTGGSSASGTSMSSPHLAGVAAVMQQRNRDEGLGLSAAEIGALMMNYARPVVMGGSAPVPVVRQGAGRTDMMGSGTGGLVVTAGDIASINLGPMTVTEPITVSRSLTLHNVGQDGAEVALAADFLNPNDDERGISVQPPSEPVVVPPGGREVVTVSFGVDPTTLRQWALWGPAGANTGAVEELEIEGYLRIGAVDAITGPLGAQPLEVTVPFYALPRRASSITGRYLVGDDTSLVRLSNASPWPGDAELFHLPVDDAGDALTADPDEPTVPGELDVDVVGARFEGGHGDAPTRLTFGLVRHEVATIPQQTRWDVVLDVDRDGEADHVIRDEARGDRMETTIRTVGADGAITGTAVTTDTMHVTDLHTRLTMLSVPVEHIGLDGPSDVRFYVEVTGRHEDWHHLGIGDRMPDDGWARLEVPNGRGPLSTTVTVPGGEVLDVPVALPAVSGDIAPFLVLLPANTYDVTPGDGAQQADVLDPRPLVRPVLLPALLRNHTSP